jgi:hypothetical protein
MDKALVLSPPELVQKHADAAQRLCDRYPNVVTYVDVAKAADTYA